MGWVLVVGFLSASFPLFKRTIEGDIEIDVLLPCIANLPEETRTNIELYRQHFKQKEGHDELVFGDSSNEFMEINFD